MIHIKEFQINENRNYTIEDLLEKYEGELSSIEMYEKEYSELVGLSDKDYYSAGELNGKIQVLRELVSDIQRNFL